MKAYQIDVNSDLCADDTSAVVQAHESNLIVTFSCTLKQDYDVDLISDGNRNDREIYRPTFDVSVEIVSIHAVLQDSITALVDMSSIEPEWLDELVSGMEAQIEYNAWQDAMEDAA